MGVDEVWVFVEAVGSDDIVDSWEAVDSRAAAVKMTVGCAMSLFHPSAPIGIASMSNFISCCSCCFLKCAARLAEYSFATLGNMAKTLSRTAALVCFCHA